MSDAVLVALITGGFSILSSGMGILVTSRKAKGNIETIQAVTNTKLEELTREVREHNGFARRMPVVEEQIKVINHRIEDLETENKNR